MKKRIAFTCFALCFLLLFSACANSEKTDSGKRYDYDLTKYLEVPDLSDFKVPFEDPTVCTEEELLEAEEQILLSYATFEPKEGVVERFNKIVLDYRMYRDGKEMEDYTEKEYRIVVGSEGHGAMDYAIGMTMIGASVGEERETTYTFPEDDVEIGAWAGLTVTLKGCLKEIYQHRLPEMNDEFVSNLGSEQNSYESVEQFRDELRGQILLQKEAQRDRAVFNGYMDSVKVKKYPKKELNACMEKDRQSIENEARQLGFSMEQYLSQYMGSTAAALEVYVENMAKEQVKNDMACIQLSRVLGTTLSEEEYRSGLERLFEEEGGEVASGFETVEQFEAHYTKWEIRQSLLWEKSFRTLVERAKRLDP